jgi:hypothetical protein
MNNFHKVTCDVCGLHSSGSEQDSVAVASEHCNNPTSPINKENVMIIGVAVSSQRGPCSTELDSYMRTAGGHHSEALI